MAKVKIISNPYEKKTCFQCWESNVGWMTIGEEQDKDSHLLNEKITSSFFPFKAEEIIETIIEEYSDSHNSIELVFEGTEDEYQELKLLCEDTRYQPFISLSEKRKSLPNADVTFEKIKQLFSERLSKLIKSMDISEQMKNECEKYVDASNDSIPICVVGNYSTGKSTFINALIGNELLVSNAKTSTAWNYKIMCSPNEEHAEIHFCCEGVPIDFIFEKTQWSATNEEHEIVREIIKKISNIEQGDVILQVRTALAVINRSEKDFGLLITGAIEIKVPFRKSVLMKDNQNFIIFDTPGSNSASYQNHTEVLKKALEGLSNGILLFVTDYDHMDGNDNEALYRTINKMKEFDSRFAMIVINRIDMQNGLPKEGFSKEEKEELLEEAIPRNLYSAGIYFVSSVMGLGSKNDGMFVDPALRDAYCKLKKIAPEDELYRKYYIYNILPGQLEEEERKNVGVCENAELADSGLFSIENRIKQFAEKYSVYNKCVQSKIFLENVVVEIAQMIQSKKATIEESRASKKNYLEEQKKELLDQIELFSRQREKGYADHYDGGVPIGDAVKKYKADFDYFLNELFKNKKNQVRSGMLKDNESKMVVLKNEMMLMFGLWLKPTEKRQLIDQANEMYRNNAREIQEAVNSLSRTYWENMTEDIKSELTGIIVGSYALTDENKGILRDVIMNYETIQFADYSQEVFAPEFTDKKSADKLKEWLQENYNFELEKAILPICNKIKNSHAESFNKWCSQLQKAIEENIEDYSPKLKELAKQLDKEDQKVRQIEEKQHEIEACAEEIKKMMEWREEE